MPPRGRLCLPAHCAPPRLATPAGDAIKLDFSKGDLHRCDPDEGGLLMRGINYRNAFEPFEAANYAHMQNNKHNAANDAPYMMRTPDAADTDPYSFLFNDNVCPSRFRWLEDEKYGHASGGLSLFGWITLRRPKQALWALRKAALVGFPDIGEVREAEEARLPVFQVDEKAWEALNKSTKDGLLKHWNEVWRAYRSARADAAPAGAPPAASDTWNWVPFVCLQQVALLTACMRAHVRAVFACVCCRTAQGIPRRPCPRLGRPGHQPPPTSASPPNCGPQSLT